MLDTIPVDTVIRHEICLALGLVAVDLDQTIANKMLHRERILQTVCDDAACWIRRKCALDQLFVAAVDAASVAHDRVVDFLLIAGETNLCLEGRNLGLENRETLLNRLA